MIDNYGYQGYFKIKRKYIDGTERTETIKNAITDVAINQLIGTLLGDAPDLEIKYLAIGTGSAPINNADTQLGTEIFRTPPTTAPTETANNEVTTIFTVLDSEAVANWKEIGIFVGASATSTANTGTMLSRILYDEEKTALEEVEITRIDRIVRV